MSRFSRIIGILGLLCLLIQDAAAETRTIVMGGENGLAWRRGGGDIQAVLKTGSKEVERGNTPGGVVEFDPEGRRGWIFPQRIDEEKNLAEGILERGGSVYSLAVLESSIDEQLALMIDNDGETALVRKNVAVIRGMDMNFDLGARFGVTAIQFFPRNAHPDFPAPEFLFQEDFIRGYELFFNDGSEETQSVSGPELISFKLEPRNEEAVVDLRIPPQYVRFIRLQARTSIGFEIAEFRAFGTGFVPSAEYISSIFDLGPDLGLWSTIRWVEESLGPEGFSNVRIRTRTGLDDTPLVFNRRFFQEGVRVEVPWKEGTVVTAEGHQINLNDLEVEGARAVFSELPLEERNRVILTLDDYLGLGPDKGEIQEDLDAWSPWSSPYDLEGMVITPENIDDDQLGVRIVSPGPRRYIQFRIDFLSESLDAATGIGPLAFTVSSPPIAEQIIGEIFPRKVELGVPVTFTYAVMPTKIRPGVDIGFDSFEIVTPVRVEAVEEIQVVYPDGQTESADFSREDLNALPISDATGRFSIDAVEERGLRVRFPAMTESDLAAERSYMLQIRFRGRVLRYGTKFSGFARNSREGDVAQEVIAGNVAELDELDDDIVPLGTATLRGLSVDVSLSGSAGDLLINVEAVPRPFSPNGDGINDVTNMQYNVSRLMGAAPVEIEVFDLAGRLVRQVFSGEQGSGSFSIPWDGTNAAGELLPPGIYLFHVSLDSDASREEVVKTVELVY